MHMLKRVLLLCLLGAGVQAGHSQSATNTTQTQGNSGTAKGTVMDTAAEKQARDLLRQYTGNAADQARPVVAAPVVAAPVVAAPVVAAPEKALVEAQPSNN